MDTPQPSGPHAPHGHDLLARITALFLGSKLPRDAGRAFAHEGTLSAGKPRGAGLIFILAFIGATLLSQPLNLERWINLALILAAMLAGYFDDREIGRAHV